MSIAPKGLKVKKNKNRIRVDSPMDIGENYISRGKANLKICVLSFKRMLKEITSYVYRYMQYLVGGSSRVVEQ